MMPRTNFGIRDDESLWRVSNIEQSATSSAIDSAGKYTVLASSLSRDVTVRRLSNFTADAISSLRVTHYVSQVAISHNGDFIAVSSEDGVVTVFSKMNETDTHEKVYVLRNWNFDEASGCAVTPNFSHLAVNFRHSEKESGATVLYECNGSVKPAEPLAFLSQKGRPGKCYVSRHGGIIAFTTMINGNSQVKVFSRRRERFRENMQTIECAPYPAIDIDEKGKVLVVADWNQVRLFTKGGDSDGFSLIFYQSIPKAVSPFCSISPSGSCAIAGNYLKAFLIRESELGQLQGVNSSLVHASVHQARIEDSVTVVSCNSNGRVFVFNLEQEETDDDDDESTVVTSEL